MRREAWNLRFCTLFLLVLRTFANVFRLRLTFEYSHIFNWLSCKHERAFLRIQLFTKNNKVQFHGIRSLVTLLPLEPLKQSQRDLEGLRTAVERVQVATNIDKMLVYSGWFPMRIPNGEN